MVSLELVALTGVSLRAPTCRGVAISSPPRDCFGAVAPRKDTREIAEPVPKGKRESSLLAMTKKEVVLTSWYVRGLDNGAIYVLI
jgi:hypothetical protein